jgi:hypothetical protein
MKRILLSVVLTGLGLGTASLAAIRAFSVESEVFSVGAKPRCIDDKKGLAVCVENPIIKIGEGQTAKLTLTIKNSGTVDRDIELTSGSSKYRILVFDPKGRTVAKRMETKLRAHTMSEEDEKRWASSLWVNRHGGSLPPGSTLSEELDLTGIYDLTEPGKYTVKLSRSLTSVDGNTYFLELPTVVVVVCGS